MIEKNRIVFLFAIFILAAAFALNLIMGCASAPIEKVEESETFKAQEMRKPVWNIGDTWIYKIHSFVGGKENKIIQKRIFIKEEDGKYVISWAKGTINTYYDPSDLNAMYQKDASGKLIYRWIPKECTFDWPLKVKKWWNASLSWHPQGPDDPPYITLTIKVEAQEFITIMGKEIMTFKLLEKQYNPRGALIAEKTRWVSPEYKNVVKWKDVRNLANRYYEGELIEFIPAKKN